MGYQLLTEPRAQPKLGKSLDIGWANWAIHLAPHDLSGRNVCPKSTPGCRKYCIYWQGRGAMSMAQKARIRRTDWLFENPQSFKLQLIHEITAALRWGDRHKVQTAIRLNGTSDIVWEKKWPTLFDMFHEVTFYDYTKIPKRKTPENYHLTFSRSESNKIDCAREFSNGKNVAVVFRTNEAKPSECTITPFVQSPVYDGDKNDCRFLDPPGHVIALRAKGSAKHDATGFVVD